MTHHVKITLEVTNSDGSPFCSNVLNYADVPRPALVAIEKVMVAMLSDLTALGEDSLKTEPAPAA